MEKSTEKLTEKSTEKSSESVKIPKKRGRKPKGGKIVANKTIINNNLSINKPNIILHLKCKVTDLNDNNMLTNLSYRPVIDDVESFNKSQDIFNTSYEEINNKQQEIKINNSENINDNIKEKDDDLIKILWKKLKDLETNLVNNNVSKKSCCFWCSYNFDNPSIIIPKYELENKYYVYGSFCTPQCATAFLLNESIDTSTKFERYSLLNNIYGKIYNYEKNIKPAPNPLYLLDKYYGNLTIQEYRKLLENDKIITIVDKPMVKLLPSLYEDNNDNINNKKINTDLKYNLNNKAPLQESNFVTKII